MYLAARLATGLLLLTVWLYPALDRPVSPVTARLAKWTWTAGCALLWVHVGLAFHFEHDWSHAAAYRATAERTEAVMGWYWGGGVYVNYATMLLWSSDVLVEWTRWGGNGTFLLQWRRIVRGYLLLMAFQASVVFAAVPARWVALAVWGLFALELWRRGSRSPHLNSPGG